MPQVRLEPFLNINISYSENLTAKLKEGASMNGKPAEILNQKALQTGVYLPIHKKALRDRVQVFLFNHLSVFASPHPEVLLTPGVRPALIEEINWAFGGYGFPRDLQQILDAFILTHINQISISSLTANPLLGLALAKEEGD